MNSERKEELRVIGYGRAILEGLQEEMRNDENIILMGEDIRQGMSFPGAPLIEEFGLDRVRDTPISELGFVGCAVGAARTGLKPVVEIMFDGLLPIACEQIINQATTMRYMFGEENSKLPIVIRSTGGAGFGLAGHHSAYLADWFMHIPGIKIAAPSTPYDAKGLIKTAIRDNNPVLFSESRRLNATEGPVPEQEYTIPFGKGDIKKHGEDVTLVAVSYMVPKALEAAEKLEGMKISAEVVDPRTLVPLDIDMILSSVKKTGRVVIAHESWKRCGVGAEIAAIIAEEALEHLDAPIKRVTGKEAPMPFSPPLEQYMMPGSDDIIRAVREVVR